MAPGKRKTTGIGKAVGKYPTKALLLYDERCPMCCNAVEMLKQLGLLKVVTASPWPNEKITNARTAETINERLRSELLFYNPGNGELQGGFHGLLRLLEVERKYLPLQWFASRHPWVNVGQTLYKVVSLNRRILTPPVYSPIPCTCDPPLDFASRATLWMILLAIAFLGSAVFGGTLVALHPERYVGELALQLTAAAGAGWALNFTVFALVFRTRYWEFVQQCMVVMAIGIFWLMVASLLILVAKANGVARDTLMVLTILSVTINSLIMFRSIYMRSSALAFPAWVPWLWLGLLELGGIPLFLYFKLFQLEGV